MNFTTQIYLFIIIVSISWILAIKSIDLFKIYIEKKQDKKQ